MIVTCGKCKARFKIDPSIIDPDGAKVRCSKCRTVFRVHPPRSHAAKDPQPQTPLDAPFVHPPKDVDVSTWHHDLDSADQEVAQNQSEAQDSIDIELKNLDFEMEQQEYSDHQSGFVQDISTLEQGEFQKVFHDASDSHDLDSLPQEPPEMAAKPPDAEMAIPDFSIDIDAEDHAPVEKTIDVELSEHRMFPTAAVSSRRKGRRLGWLLVVLLLVACFGGGYYYFRKAGITLPHIDKLWPSKPAEVAEGAIEKLATVDVSSRFLTNMKAGRVFVVNGQVKNDFATPRSRIRIRGNLFIADKRPVKTKTTYAGNLLSDLELINLSANEIDSRLAAPLTDDAAAPGETLPFMIVFFQLPENLEEYTLEIISAQKPDAADKVK